MSMCGPIGDGRRDDHAFEVRHGFDPRGPSLPVTFPDGRRDWPTHRVAGGFFVPDAGDGWTFQPHEGGWIAYRKGKR